MRHRSVLAAGMLLCGCGSEPAAGVREVRAHWLTACAPMDQPAATIDLEALGDFEASPLTSETFDEDATRSALLFPLETRAVDARATTGFQTFHGTGQFNETDVLDLSLWPTEESCRLPAPTSDYPRPGGGQTFGYAPALGLLLLAGGVGDGVAASGALTVSVGTGEVLETEGMNRRRTQATVTPFGDGFLVAGGEDPVAPEQKGDAIYLPHATGEVYDPATRGFELIDLGEPRSRHAAVVLDSGATVLIGGQAEDGGALRTLVAVDPITRRTDRRLAALQEGRIHPTAFLLDDGRILVAGGEDADGNPVETLEWLTGDAKEVLAVSDALTDRGDPPTFNRAFTPMPAGAALAVGGCAALEAGRDPPEDWCRSVRWITAEGDVADALDLAQPMAQAQLVPAADGSPWLFGNDLDGAPVRQRFDPWQARFLTPLLPPQVTLEPDVAAPIPVDPGLFVWLGPGSELRGFRDNLRGPFTRDVGPLGLGDPSHLAPNQRPSDAIAFETGEVRLTSSGIVAITDTSYLDVSLEVIVREGPAPVVRLDDESFGGEGCRWPNAAPDEESTFVFSRTGSTVSLSVGERRRACDASSQRARLFLTTHGQGELHIASIRVRRGSADGAE